MVEIERIVSFEELEPRVRNVPLLHSEGPDLAYPYADARISLKEFSYADIAPTTLYVLNQNLMTQDVLASRLDELGHDPLSLDSALELADKDGNIYGLLPPIVEETPEGMCLIDGIHRNYQPRLLGRTSFIGLAIEDANKDYPFYAYPNKWNEIVAYDEVPADPALKKRYRVENPYALYRDFGSLKMAGPRSS